MHLSKNWKRTKVQQWLVKIKDKNLYRILPRPYILARYLTNEFFLINSTYIFNQADYVYRKKVYLFPKNIGQRKHAFLGVEKGL